MAPHEFEFSAFSTIRDQKRRLLSASEFRELPLHPALTGTLARLKTLSSEEDMKVTKRSLWMESLHSVRPLLLASTFWQSIAIIGMVSSLIATRYVLVVDNGWLITIFICCSFLVAELSKNVVHYFDMPRRAQLARGVQLHLFAKINRKLLVVDPAQRSEFTTGNVKTLVAGDAEAVEDFITAASQAWIPAILTLCLTTPPILYLTGTLGAVGIGCTLMQLPIALVAAHFVERFKGRRQTEQDRLTTVIGEWVRNVRLVRYLHRESAIVREIAKIVKRFSIESIKAHVVILVSFAITYSWWTVPILVMVFMSTLWEVSLGASSFFPSLWLLSLLSNQVQFLPHSLTHYGSAAAAISRLERFFNLKNITRFIRERSVDVDQVGVPVRILIKDLSLSYGGDEVLLLPELTIDLSKRTAIVGEVGGGKSTLLQVICGEIAPTKGSIEIEFSSGVRASIWCSEVRERWRSFISYSPQEPFLSNATLRSNIDLRGQSDHEADDESLNTAVVAAHLSADISQLAYGLEQEVGETGINLSGGQRQRVSLARAFLSKRPYMVLDDPLSAVDAATEGILMQSFIRECQGFLLVSHRMEHLVLCDRVIVLSNGRVLEDGIPRILREDRLSAFAQLFFARSRGRDE